MAAGKKGCLGKFLIALAVILVIFIVLPISIAFIVLYDGNTKKINIPEQTSTEFMNSYKETIVRDSMDYTDQTGIVDFKISEDNFNTLLYYAYAGNEEIDPQVLKYIPKAYIDINPNKSQYVFYVEAKVAFFKTRVSLVTEVSEMEGEKGLALTMHEAKVGKLSALVDIADSIVSEDTMDGLFTGTGLNFTVDWSKKQIQYKVTDLLNDFNIANAAGGSNLFAQLIGDIFRDNPEVIGFDFYKDRAMNIEFDLHSAHNTDVPAPAVFDNTIAATIDHFSSIKDRLLTEDEINDYFYAAAQSNGEKPAKSEKSVQEYLDANKTSFISTYLTEDEFNTFVRGSDLVAKSYPFYDKTSMTDRKMNFVVINDFYCDVKPSGKVDFVIGININGYDTQMVINTTMAETLITKGTNTVLEFTMDDIHYGSISMFENGQPKQIILDLIKEGFKKGDASDDLIQIDGNKISFIMDSGVYSPTNTVYTTNDRININII